MEFKYCKGNLENLKDYVKENIKNKIPVLLSIKARTHIVSFTKFPDSEFSYFEPGDGRICNVNYKNNDFKNLIQEGDYHTLVIKKK